MKKRLFSLLLVAVMAISFCQPAFAENIGSNDINDLSSADMLLTEKATRLTEIVIQSENAAVSISNVRTLKDFSGNEYTLVECVPTGYYILHNASGQYIEYSPESPSPYSKVSGDLYYGGPTYYFVKNGASYVGTMDTTVINASLGSSESKELIASCDKINASMMECKNEAVASYIADDSVAVKDIAKVDIGDMTDGKDVSALQSDSLIKQEAVRLEDNAIVAQAAARTDYWVTSYSFFKTSRASNFGYYCPSGSNGVCGYIAANLILQYEIIFTQTLVGEGSIFFVLLLQSEMIT